MESTSGYSSYLWKSFTEGNVFTANSDSEYELDNSDCDDESSDLCIQTGFK